MVLRFSRDDGSSCSGEETMMIKNKPWRSFFCAQAVIALVAGYGSPAQAEYPESPVHIIVPVAAGGGVDVMARMLAQKLGERLNQTFVVENRPGAAGIIGSRSVIAATPDGYTLLYTPSSLSLSVVVHQTPPYDVTKDFTPIINVAISPYTLVVNPSVPAHNLKEFIAYAKANPGKLSYSSPGVGSASHLAAEMLKTMAGIDMVHVPNKGMSPAVLDLIGGQVQVLFASVPSIVKQKPDKLRPIAMAEMKRSALLPDLPTINESGVPGFAVANWAGLLGPAGLDPKIVKKLHDEIIAIIATAEMKERIKMLGYDLIESTPEEFANELKNDIDRWGPVAKRAGVSVK
jgi:tripartite-type tricarboxylate transporter receptor subunit TctC